MFNVARYLDDFIDSIERQVGLGEGELEVIAVDDGSSDATLDLVSAWALRRPDLVTVISKSNSGQGGARNAGIIHARGEWITFTDPDDVLGPDYLSVVARMISRRPATQMVATPRLVWDERSGRISKSHPTQWMFASDQYVNLNRYPDFFHGSAATAFLRRDIITRTGLQFDSRVRPNFEDGHFIARYLFAVDEPVVAFAGSAHYLYRKRADGSSTVQNATRDSNYYVSVPRWGYLDALQKASARFGAAPEWLQSLVLYELSWYFRVEEASSGAHSRAVGDTAREFREILTEISTYISTDHLNSFDRPRFYGPWREYLAHGLKGDTWHSPYVVLTGYDDRAQQVRISYRYTGHPPQEEILLRGVPVAPVAGKRRGIDFFGATHVWERIAWVSAKGTLRVKLNGVPMEVRRHYPGAPKTVMRPREIEAWFARPTRQLAEAKRRARGSRVMRWATSPLVRRIVGTPWILVDRMHNAADSAEVLFRHLRTSRRDINSWFVIERTSADYRRLRREGFLRLVSPGSILWKVLMANAEVVISSHADIPITDHPDIVKHGKPKYKFVFLQHGVIKDDLSSWLNQKEIAVFVTSTPDEHASIVGDDTGYIFTSKETKLTGLPRFDALLRADKAIPDDQKNLIVFAPTWRYWLVPPTKADSQRRDLVGDFISSEFAKAWVALLSDPRVRDSASDHGMRLAFVPHPNMAAALDVLDIPDHVVPLTLSGDVQSIFARARVLITDYSSMVFNTAYLNRAAVYYQFDAERFDSGGHVGKKGYFDYRTHGFGPVAIEHEEAVEHIVDAIRRGGVPAAEFQSRIDRAFPTRDGRSSARVTAAIEKMLRRR